MQADGSNFSRKGEECVPIALDMDRSSRKWRGVQICPAVCTEGTELIRTSLRQTQRTWGVDVQNPL